VLAAPASADGRSGEWHYVVGEGGHGFVTDTPTGAVRRGAGVTSDGSVVFTPTGSTFTVTVRDAAARAGQSVPFRVTQWNAAGRATSSWQGCQPVDTPREYVTGAGVTGVELVVMWPAWLGVVGWGCAARGTTGVLELRY
jgi:hypothetical protein